MCTQFSHAEGVDGVVRTNVIVDTKLSTLLSRETVVSSCSGRLNAENMRGWISVATTFLSA